MEQVLAGEINAQITYERYSADVYMSLAVRLDVLNLWGMAHWMYKQADEERQHAKKFIDFLSDRNEAIVIDALNRPPSPADGADIMRAGQISFRAALDHEKTVTARIWNLYNIAEEVNDPDAMILLHWYISEQREEEKTLEEILTKFTLASNDGAALIALDHLLGER